MNEISHRSSLLIQLQLPQIAQLPSAASKIIKIKSQKYKKTDKLCARLSHVSVCAKKPNINSLDGTKSDNKRITKEEEKK